MRIRFVAQPFEDGIDLRDFLRAVAGDPGLQTLRVVVAWAKRSGLARAADDLRAVRDRGGTIFAIVGVSEGGATHQGLQALIDQCDEARVFHDRGRTFHPKVYLADGPDHALLLVGSHNLTAGGLAWNYEAGLWCELDLSADPDAQVRQDVVDYFNRLRNDAEVCLPLNGPSLTAILADNSLIIQDEDVRRSAATDEPDAPEDSDSTEVNAEEPPQRVFGRSTIRKRQAPILRRSTPWGPLRRRPAPVTGAVPGSRPTITVARRWFKRMDGTAAQQPPGGNTNPTGNLRLSQEDFSIDHTTYFSRVFFGGLDWRAAARTPDMEEVRLSFDTVVAGDYLGAVNLRVSHLPSRISNQGNVPTVLHWGDLGGRLRANNYVGLFVTLERGCNDEFQLTIAPQPTGEFWY